MADDVITDSISQGLSLVSAPQDDEHPFLRYVSGQYMDHMQLRNRSDEPDSYGYESLPFTLLYYRLLGAWSVGQDKWPTGTLYNSIPVRKEAFNVSNPLHSVKTLKFWRG